VIRTLLFVGIVAAAVIGAIGYGLPAHRIGSDEGFHSNYADGGPAPFFTFAAAAACAAAMWRRRWGAGLVVGFTAMVAAFFSLLPVLLVHMFSTVEHASGEDLYDLGVVGLIGLGLATIVAEPILYRGQRRQLERDVDPQFPSARALR